MSIQFARDRFAWSNFLVESLKQGCVRTFGRRLGEIVQKNERLTGTKAYHHDGKGYFAEPLYVFPLSLQPRGMTVGALHSSLESLHGEWASDYAHYLHHGKRVSQTLLSLMGKAQGVQELRDMLPDNVYRVFPQDHPLQRLTPSRPNLYACSLEDATPGHWDPKLVQAYQGISSLVDTYVGYNLL